MKVNELISKLGQLDPNLEVYCYEDGPVAIQGINPGPFGLVDVSSASVLVSRDLNNHEVRFKFEGDVPGVRKLAIIGITPDL